MSTNFPPAAGSSRPAVPAGPSRLGLALVVYAVVLGMAGLWLLVTGLPRRGPTGLPSERASARAGGAAFDPRAIAQLETLRGDGFADAAMADADLPRPERPGTIDRAPAERLDAARSAVETSLALAPVDAEGWLFLAELPTASGGADPRIASLLKMAYFTAPNAVALAPRRLQRAASSTALADPEIQDFARTDIRRLLADKPHQRQAIAVAYRNALPQNRPVLETLVADIDSGFARSLRSGLEK